VIGVGLRSLSTLMSGEDLALVRDLANERTGVLTALAHGASWLGRSYVLLPCAVAIAGCAIAFGQRVKGLVMIIGVVGAVIIENVDKLVIGRPRPPGPRLEHVSGTSFPSGHTTQATAFFLLLLVALLSGRRPRSLKLLAVLATALVIGGVAWSRVYLGVHYPSDTIAGILLGGAWSLVAAAILLRPHSGSVADGRTDGPR
jgi:undecaprenyl-diphosphatase